MNIVLQYIIRLKDYFSTKDLRRVIPLFSFTVLLILFFSFYQYQFQSIIFTSKYSNKSIDSAVQSKPILTKLIVISHFNEDLDWLDLFIGEHIPHIVYTRSSDALARHNIKINKGREAVAYLQYIIDNYSNLSSSIAFVHAHRTSWHQKDPSDIVIALRALQWHKYNYMPLTSTMTHAMFRTLQGDAQSTVNYELWRDVLQKELGAPPVNGIKAPCCASFVVKKEAILKHSKVFYSNILDYIIASKHSDQLTGRTLEYTWHMIFGEPAHVSYRTCDLFVCDSKGMISVQLAEKN